MKIYYFRESLLLWNPGQSSNYDSQKIISSISHELAHFWFGNLVTTDWWDNLFLNEGFATYFEYFIPASVSIPTICVKKLLGKAFRYIR